jgi:hypothetical protein
MEDIHKILRSYVLSRKSFKEKFSEILELHGHEVLSAFLEYEAWSLKKMLTNIQYNG